jgi:beta-glucanase (GH16 family)
MINLKHFISIAYRNMTLALLAVVAVPFLSACGDDNPDFTPDFSFGYVNPNHVTFTNESVGEYYSLVWDFGNGIKDTSTNKLKTYTIYYPNSGTYSVQLECMNYNGEKAFVSKSVQILSDDLVVSFTAVINALNPNEIILTNTSTGVYDSIQWSYRGKLISGSEVDTAYFPSSGVYSISMIVYKSEQPFEESKTVSIAQDDPNYIEHLELVWEDEFTGTELNMDNWTYDTGSGGWGNNELQNYTAGDNLSIVDGKLIITARKVNENTQVGSYTSSRIKSYGKNEFKYGRMEFRAKLPVGRGVWPALWMLGSDFYTVGWPACGEIDIMEYVGYQPNTVFCAVHTPSGYGNNGGGGSLTVPTCEEAFHLYGIIWTDKRIDFYIDSPEQIVYTYAPATLNASTWPYDKEAFFIINLAIGGNWGGAQGIDNSIFPATLEVDYIKVYQER